MDLLESLKNVEGLTSYVEGKLPKKLRQFLLGHKETRDTPLMDDADLVNLFLRDEWLGEWGAATINGKEHAIFESVYYHCSDSKIVQLLLGANCGFVFVHQRAGAHQLPTLSAVVEL